MIRRKTPLKKRSAKFKARHARSQAKRRQRRAAEFARVYGSVERVEWVKRQLCFMCSDVPCENAHIITGGMGRKSDYTSIVPLCHAHHAMLHRVGRIEFENRLMTDLHVLAAHTHTRWLRYAAQQGLDA